MLAASLRDLYLAFHHQSQVQTKCGLTLRCTRPATAGFASLRRRVNSNVRRRPSMLRDNWLDRWLPVAVARAGGAPVLEVGCGHGDDTAALAAAGLRVVAFDLSAAAVGI